MSSKVVVTPNFQREAKKLKKKYPSLKKELKDLIESLEHSLTHVL
jgi:mRNA-degrading endonuclease RelE of RelBE toxin-antitoxin system